MKMNSEADVFSVIDDKKQDNENEATVSERNLIRQKLSMISFEDLQKLKEKIGSKKYNEVVFGTKSKKEAPVSFKRANKNRPREMSSKRRFHLQDQSGHVKKLAARDPRFDPLCGTFDDKTFKSNYKFLKDVRKKECTQLEKEYKDEVDPKKKEKIKYLIQRMKNQIREQENREKLNQGKEEDQKNIRTQLMQGQKPVFKKKSEKRLEGLINKYEELKKNNKLQKHLERRHKKLASKEKKQSKFNTLT